MTAISPEARALIDRLHAVDIARPKLDSEAVENAFNRHLAALGLPARPIREMPDASSAYRHMIDLGRCREPARCDAGRPGGRPLDLVQSRIGRAQRRAWSRSSYLPGRLYG